MNAREIAFIAVFNFLKDDKFIQDSLDEWISSSSPSTEDIHLAKQIAFGAVQRAKSLDYIANQVADKQKLSLKVKEKALLRTSVYQLVFLKSLPAYAVVDETIKIAKKTCYVTFVKFLNALLRKIASQPIELPKSDLSVLYSYPENFVDSLIEFYGLKQAEKVLKLGNEPASLMARVKKNTLEMVNISAKEVFEIAASKDYYIQNITPAHLIYSLAKNIKLAPKTILDVCAAPGGKTVALSDLFPESQFYVNDVTEHKIKKIKENLSKYGIEAIYSVSDGREISLDKKMDLIILDVPCSNTGVLNKRPEARWRLSSENTKQLNEIQLGLIKHAKELLNEDGQIWYMTCSISKEENEELIKKACEEFDLKVVYQELILPNEEGWDGGFAAILEPL